LVGAASLSPSNAWAVGESGVAPPPGPDQGLVLHWTGSNWRRQANPTMSASRTAFTSLDGVTATSPSNAWAVGHTFNWTFSRMNPFSHTAERTVILRWDGTSWQRQATPDLGPHDNVLRGVAATSATDAWAVGYHNGRRGSQPLILHCC
jgi:hypothetical protein